ncbi:MAG: hypothetical protein ISS79_02455 [Phycisphaerae bacterium]|nr:hypothetical protein [Phycisphaerae bacterium]
MGEHWRIPDMRRRWIWLVLFVAILVVAATLVHLCGRSGRATEDPNTWTTAEWHYHGRLIRRVVQKWFKSVETAPSRARIKDSYQTYLVIDTNEPAIWIEDSGNIRKDTRMELPGSMKWRLYRRTPKGDSALSGLLRLRARGLGSEMFFLVGTEAAVGYLSISFGPGTNSSGWFKPWAFRMPGRYPWQDEWQEQVRSVVVSEDEYERNMGLVQRPSAIGTSQTQPHGQVPPVVKRNETRWLAVEKELYLEIERQFSDLGYDLTSIKVYEGPAMTAGLARAGGRKLGWIDKIYRGRRTEWTTCSVALEIDYLGDDVWYVVSDPNRKSGNADKYLDMEFLVKAEGALSRKERKEWTRKGRMAAKISPEQPSPWRATLDNGISVELIGICESPSNGRQWWGPDGSILDYIPYYRTYTRHHKPDERAYDFAYKVVWPDGMPQRGYSSGVTGRIAHHTGVGLKDRFGDDSRFQGGQRIYVFKQSTEKTTMTWVFGKNDKESQYIYFKNISLVPGKDFGFEIETRVKIRR